MGFWGKLATGLKIGGKSALAIASATNPALAGISGTIQNLILEAESAKGPGKGAEKKQVVLDGLKAGLPLMIPFIEHAMKIDIDDEEFVDALGGLVDSTVKLMNSLKQLPKST